MIQKVFSQAMLLRLSIHRRGHAGLTRPETSSNVHVTVPAPKGFSRATLWGFLLHAAWRWSKSAAVCMAVAVQF